MFKNRYDFSNLKNDLPSAIVVFLVALPLCLGIALASGAPLFSGLIAGIVGGLVVGSLSGSQLAVSGPAAGLTVIVVSAIEKLGSFEAFLLAVVLAGLLQIIFGVLKAGLIGHFFPSAVIKGMLAAIGLILILKQIPHAFGYDANYEGDQSFIQMDGENTFSEIVNSLNYLHPGAVVISLLSLFVLILWETKFIKSRKIVSAFPAPLLVVIMGIMFNQFFNTLNPLFFLDSSHLVNLPEPGSLNEFFGQFTLPDFGAVGNVDIYIIAFTIAIVASLESLLSLDATDKMDPQKRIAPVNQELKAQGMGNLVSGLIGGIPLTAVIVRSSANISSGAKSKASAILHGVFLLVSVMAIPHFLNLIPLSSLAAILLMVGYKLTKPVLFQEYYKKGWSQFIPFVVTIGAILFTDLLIGIIIGMGVGMYFVFKNNSNSSVSVTRDNHKFLIRLNKDVSFLNKAALRHAFQDIPDGAYVIIDGSRAFFIDEDIKETIYDFVDSAELRNIHVEFNKKNMSKNNLFKIQEPEISRKTID